MWLNWACLGASNTENGDIDPYLVRADIEATFKRLSQWVGSWTGCGTDSVVLTSGATEGLDLAVRAFLTPPVRNLVVPATAHSTSKTVAQRAVVHVARLGMDVRYVELPIQATPDSNRFADAFCQITHGEPSVVVVEHLAAETGVVTDICSLRDRLAEVGPHSYLLVDGAQAAGIVAPPPSVG